MTSRRQLPLLLTTITLFITIIIKNVENLSQSCPPAELISPCTCYEAGILANLQCTGINDQAILMHVINESDSYQCKGFDLMESSVEYIPASIFNTEKPTKINVLQSSLVSLFDQPPPVENNLKILVVNALQISNGFQWEMFAGFKKLNFFTVMNTLVGKIDSSFSTHAPKSMGLLAFYNCSVSELDDFAFASMLDLTEIYVQHGTIKELKRSMFPSLSKLEKIAFEGHQIRHLPGDIFSNMPNLVGIDLSDNALATFSQSAFGPVCPYLQFVEIDDNPIICGCNIKWITSVLSKYQSLTIDGMCSGPKELKGRSLSDLKKEDFKQCNRKTKTEL